MNKRVIISGLLFVYCLYYVSSLTSWHFIDGVNLVIHEAGHVLFTPFGYLLTIAGGSLLQIIVPFIFCGYFLYQGNRSAANMLLYWAAINFFNVSVYAADALSMKLPLLTGDTDAHDWNQILFTIGWLNHTLLVSRFIFAMGAFLILFALIWTLYDMRRTANEIIFDDHA